MTIDGAVIILHRNIYITEDDKTRLTEFIKNYLLRETGARQLVLSLDKALSDAYTTEKGQMPKDTVLIHSWVVLGFIDAEEKVKLVFPDEADVSQNMVSVVSPIGMAIFGGRKGQTVEWEGEHALHSVLIIDIMQEDDIRID